MNTNTHSTLTNHMNTTNTDIYTLNNNYTHTNTHHSTSTNNMNTTKSNINTQNNMNTNTHHSTFMIRTIIICILILNNNNHTTPLTLMTPDPTRILESSI
jgi:hypothetical protein